MCFLRWIDTTIGYSNLVATLTIWKKKRVLKRHESRVQGGYLMELASASLHYYVSLECVQCEATNDKHGKLISYR